MRYIFTNGVNKDGVNCIYCVSHFAGNAVRGIAKHDPVDEYDMEYGRRLAQARCDKKVSEKRCKRALEKVEAAKAKLLAAEEELARMTEYLSDAIAENIENECTLKNILNEKQ